MTPVTAQADEVEAEAEFVEERQLEPGEFGAEGECRLAIVERIDGKAEQAVVRVALGQQAQVVAEQLAGIEPRAVGDQVGGAGVDQFDREGAQMLFEPGAPGELHGIAGLQGRRELATSGRRGRARASGPCPATITSAMTLVSPCRRTPMIRPSPVHCMGHFWCGNSSPISR